MKQYRILKIIELVGLMSFMAILIAFLFVQSSAADTIPNNKIKPYVFEFESINLQKTRQIYLVSAIMAVGGLILIEIPKIKYENTGRNSDRVSSVNNVAGRFL